MSSSIIEDAAKLLSVNPGEIRSVEEAPGGTVIVTTDGVSYIHVPEDQPDEEGKTGLMLLAAPKENYVYAFPIYAQPVEPAAAAEEEIPDDLDLSKATAKQVLAWVGQDADRAATALEAEQERSEPRKTVVEALTDFEASAPSTQE